MDIQYVDLIMEFIIVFQKAKVMNFIERTILWAIALCVASSCYKSVQRNFLQVKILNGVALAT
jgi:hypothetical protein